MSERLVGRWPALMSEDDAAEYVGVSIAQFRRERGRATGKKEAALETEYGSFSGLVQAVLAAARAASTLDFHTGPHSYGNPGSITSCIKCDAARLMTRHALRRAIAAHDAKYPPLSPSMPKQEDLFV